MPILKPKTELIRPAKINLKKMIDLYYKSDSEKIFYGFHSNSLDVHFVYNVMQNVHQSYYATFGEKIPSKYQQKFPMPIRRAKYFEN